MSTLTSKLRQIPLVGAANARYKAWKVERDSESMRQRYSVPAAVGNFPVPTGAGLLDAVRRRIASRSDRLMWPKPIGDLHIFLVYALLNWEAVLGTALEPFGQVSQYEWRSHGFDEGDSNWLQQRYLMNKEMLKTFRTANERRPVDIVVSYVSGHTVSPEVLLDMAASGAVITNFCFDDKIYWPGKWLGGRYTSTAAIAHAVDLNLTSDPDAAGRYFAHGGLSMFHAEAADPDWYRPLGVPYEFDVSFVGAAYGWRPQLIEGLRRHGIQVECFGRGWPNGTIDNDQMNRLYARSRINLGCGGIGYSHKLLCLKGRDFEVPMSGAVYLTQDNPELSLVFDVGRDLLTYSDIDDCARIIHATLHDPGRAARIRASARARCIKDHTYKARWEGVFSALGAIEAHSAI